MAVSESRRRSRQVEHLFAEVVGLDPERREARLDRACLGDVRLREEVRVLLERHERGETSGPVREPARTPGPSTRLTAQVETRAADSSEKSHAERVAEGEEIVAGRYRLEVELGRGAMGVVYKAFDARLDRFVALKFLSPHLGADPHARARLTAEAKAVSSLDHAHICTLHEIGETDDGQLFLVMAYYEGRTLRHLVGQGPLPVGDAVRLAVGLASGLSAAHRRGVVHRDVKPANLLVTARGDIKILDFGIAKVAGGSLTRTGVTLGTVAYMSPEQLRGEVDARTDIWALGAVLYEMLTGERPFQGHYEAALLYAILHEDPVPLARFCSDVPEALEDIVQRCLKKDPTERYQSAAEVETDLNEFVLAERSPLPPLPPQAPSPSLQAARQPVRHARRWALPSLGVVAVLLTLLAPQVRSTLSVGFSEMAAPPLPRVAVMPLSVGGADASVGEAISAALRDLLTEIGPYANSPFDVVPTAEMQGVSTVERARQQLGVKHLLTGDLAFHASRARLVLLGPGVSVVADGDVGQLAALREEVVRALVDQMDVDSSAIRPSAWREALAPLEIAFEQLSDAAMSNGERSTSEPPSTEEPAAPVVAASPPGEQVASGYGEPEGATLEAAHLAFDLLTNKGRGELTFVGGDTMAVYVRTNRPAYVRIVNRLADGRRVVLEDNLYIDESRIHGPVLVGSYECAPPFGNETILAFARTEPFPPLRTVSEDGYAFLEEDLERYAARTRGFKKISVLQAEAQIRIVTKEN